MPQRCRPHRVTSVVIKWMEGSLLLHRIAILTGGSSASAARANASIEVRPHDARTLISLSMRRHWSSRRAVVFGGIEDRLSVAGGSDPLGNSVQIVWNIASSAALSEF
jgi:hypothetical protein